MSEIICWIYLALRSLNLSRKPIQASLAWIRSLPLMVLKKFWNKGAKANHLDCLNDSILLELVNVLELPLELSDKYIDSSAASGLGYMDMPKGGLADTISYNRRTALVINPQAKIMHYSQRLRAKTETTDHRSRVGSSSRCCLCWLKTSNRYNTIHFFYVILSLIWFAFFAYLAYTKEMYKFIGVNILFSRGAAWAIIVFTMIAMFFVSYDLTTCMRQCLRGRCPTLFDFQILFHRFWGYTILFYSVVHTVWHLTGTLRAIANWDDLDEINNMLEHHEFNSLKTYPELLFTTIPGITGILLFIIILSMGVTAMECTRRRCFRVFSVVHILGFPMFIILIIIHGSETWLNYGFPIGTVTVSISLLIYLIYFVRRTILKWRNPFKIINAQTYANNSFLKIVIERPKGYQFSVGQYAFINFPAISRWEWHPFSIASCTRSNKIKFIIKNSGVWTKKMVDLIAEYKLRSEKEYGRMSVDIEATAWPRDKIKYPKICLSYPISSPVQQSAYDSNVVYIATGVGITTFLSFIELQYLKSKHSKEDENDTEVCKIHDKDIIDLVFISRESENIKWISKYIKAALTLPQMTKRIRFHIYITLKDESNSLASFLFWRAMTMYNAKLMKNRKMFSAISVNLGRPDFDELFSNLFGRSKFNEHHVYACGPMVITQTLQKLAMKWSKEQNMRIHFNYEVF